MYGTIRENMRVFWSLYAVAFMFFPLAAFSQDEVGTTEISAKILAEQRENIVDISTTAANSTDVFKSLHYILIAVKNDENGNISSNKQEGDFVLNPSETKGLSNLKINLGKNGALKAFLFIKDEDNKELLAKDSLIINPAVFDHRKSTHIAEKKVELSGITIDETRTKMGKYFYDQFYMNYLLRDLKIPGTVRITENPGFGRSSRILVAYNDQPVYAFNSTPDEESIDQEAIRSLQILNNFIRNRDVNKEEN